MSSIFGVLTKRGKLKPEVIKEIILFHKANGPDGWGAVVDGKLVRNYEYKVEIDECSCILCHTLLKINDDELQPIPINNSFLSFDGCVFSSLTNSVNQHGIFEAVKAADGEFSIWHYKEGRVTLLRDSVGTRPLFYGVNKNFFAFSSVKDALHRLGIMNITSLKPGDALIYDGKMKIDTCNPLSTPSFSLEPTSLLKDELKEAVLRSVEKRVKGVKKVGVLFSSGVDSALIAHLAKNFDSELFLYCTGTESCEDVRCASQFAKKIGLDVEPITLSEEQVIEYYKKLRSLLPSSELMRIELAIPIFICSEHAKKDGVRVLLSGQGAEELFVGYDRYVQCFRRGGNLRKMLFEELKALHSKDLENNWYVASMNQCQLRYPFLDTEVIRVATSIKPEFNLKGGKKVVLREISKEMGLPPEISGRPKKAVQYGSGIHKTLIRALRKGLV